MTQLDLFLDEEEVNTSDCVDLSDIDIDFGEATHSQKICSETIRILQHLPKGKYIMYRRDAESGFPYIINTYLGQRVTPRSSRNDYVAINLKGKKGVRWTRNIHQIVAMAFIPNVLPKDRVQVDHIDGDKHNYAIENLRWVTPSENNKNRDFQ